MPRGRKPEPAAVKVAKGNPGKRRVAEHADSTPVGAVKRPTKMGTGARNLWNAIAPELERLKFLRPSDAQAFGRYCEHLYDWWELTAAIRKDGRKYLAKSDHNPEGIWRRNPDVSDRERVEKLLIALEDRFGMTPAARQQILQRLANFVPAAPVGGLFDDQEKAGSAQAPAAPQAPASPIGMLGGGARVH